MLDCGDLSTFLHIHDAFSRFSVIVYSGAKKKEEQTADMVNESAISDWAAVFGAPEIMMVGQDSRFIEKLFRNSARRVI